MLNYYSLTLLYKIISMSILKILIIATNVNTYASGNKETGLYKRIYNSNLSLEYIYLF